jgi:hypothetical protein
MGTTTDAGLGGPASRLSGCRSSRHPSGAVGTAWRPLLRRDRGPPGTSRSPMTGRASSSEDAARLRCYFSYFSSLPVLPGRSTPMRLSSAAPGYLNPGTREGPRTNQHPVGPDPVHSDDDASLTGSGADQTPGKRGGRGGLSGAEGANPAGTVGRIPSQGRTTLPAHPALTEYVLDV